MILQFIIADIMGPIHVTKNNQDLSMWHVGIPNKNMGAGVCTPRHASEQDAQSVAELLENNMHKILGEKNYHYRKGKQGDTLFIISAAQSFQGFALLDYYRPGEKQRYRFCDKRSNHKVGALSDEWIKKIFDYYPINTMTQYTDKKYAQEQVEKNYNNFQLSKKVKKSKDISVKKQCTSFTDLIKWYLDMNEERYIMPKAQWQDFINNWNNQYRSLYETLIEAVEKSKKSPTIEVARDYALWIRGLSDCFIEIGAHPDDYPSMEKNRAQSYSFFMDSIGKQQQNLFEYLHERGENLCQSCKKKLQDLRQEKCTSFEECGRCKQILNNRHIETEKRDDLCRDIDDKYRSDKEQIYNEINDDLNYNRCMISWCEFVNDLIKHHTDIAWGINPYTNNQSLETLFPDEDGRKDHIKNVYRKIVIHLHPDKNGGVEEKTEKFKFIQKIYGILLK